MAKDVVTGMFAAFRLVKGEVIEDIIGAWIEDIGLVGLDISYTASAGWLSFLKKSEDVYILSSLTELAGSDEFLNENVLSELELCPKE